MTSLRISHWVRRAVLFCISIASFVLSAHAVSAFGYDGDRQKVGLNDPLGGITIPHLINRVITQLFPLVGALFLAMFVWSGIMWLTAGGKKERVQKSITTMKRAVIGMAIVLGAYIIVSIILTTSSTIMQTG